MSAKDDLRAWITMRAHDDADVSRASTLIAAFVVEAVRADRVKQAEKAKRDAAILANLRKSSATLDEMMRGPLGRTL